MPVHLSVVHCRPESTLPYQVTESFRSQIDTRLSFSGQRSRRLRQGTDEDTGLRWLNGQRICLLCRRLWVRYPADQSCKLCVVDRDAGCIAVVGHTLYLFCLAIKACHRPGIGKLVPGRRWLDMRQLGVSSTVSLSAAAILRRVHWSSLISRGSAAARRRNLKQAIMSVPPLQCSNDQCTKRRDRNSGLLTYLLATTMFQCYGPRPKILHHTTCSLWLHSMAYYHADIKG